MSNNPGVGHNRSRLREDSLPLLYRQNPFCGDFYFYYCHHSYSAPPLVLWRGLSACIPYSSLWTSGNNSFVNKAHKQHQSSICLLNLFIILFSALESIKNGRWYHGESFKRAKISVVQQQVQNKDFEYVLFLRCM